MSDLPQPTGTDHWPGSSLPFLEVAGASKTFGGEHAIVDARLEVGDGEIHALVGSNGSGKSTLVKILAGYHRADGGTIRVHGEEVDPTAAGGVVGFRFVHQDLALIPEMTVAENLGLQRQAGTGGPRSAIAGLRPQRERREAGALQRTIDAHGLSFAATTTVAELSPADRTMVAVLRAFMQSEDPIRLLVLDEVTATLAPPEVERVFDLVRRVRSSGVSVLFVSHRIEEILTLCDCVTVLRDGRTVARRTVATTDELDLIQLITGQEPQDLYPQLSPSRRRPVLAAEGMGGGRIADVSFSLHEGEILGLASLDPSESSNVLRLVYGSAQIDDGALLIDGKPVTGHRSPHSMSTLGVSLVADRLEGGIQAFTVRENLTLNDIRGAVRWGVLDPRAERRAAQALIEDFHISPPHPDAVFSTLSGGNQQKTVLAKSMRLEPRVLLLDDPTRGVDVGAKAVLFALIREAAERGLAVLMASTDFDELAGICHRVVVLKGGRATVVLEHDALTAHTILERCYLGTGGGRTKESQL